MSMYNLLHGKNSDSDLLLAALGLNEDSVGRFRNVWVTEEGEIAVYTRNGGGNRDCWHTDSQYGNAECKNEPFEKQVRATERRAGSSSECGCGSGPTYLGAVVEHEHWDGSSMKTDTWYRCLNPQSADCACPGCTIEFRLPSHPLYLRDEDDDFDSTYATIYFRAPDSIPDEYPRGVSGDEQWARTLELLRASR